jgi:hypothetical protein
MIMEDSYYYEFLITSIIEMQILGNQYFQD